MLSCDRPRVRVIRDGRVFEVNFGSALEGSAAGRVILYSNDYVMVPRRRGFGGIWFMRLGGPTGRAMAMRMRAPRS